MHVWLLTLSILFSAAAWAANDPPTVDYQQTQLHGFTVRIHPDVARNNLLYHQTLNHLDRKLAEMRQLMGASIADQLTVVPIWVERNHQVPGQAPAAVVFHLSRGWLTQNGYNGDKEKSIEVSSAERFMQWSQFPQPMILIHEFAHAYMHLYLGDKIADIEAAWQNALANKLYQKVQSYRGIVEDSYVHSVYLAELKFKSKGYARAEYFAEITEAYFGKNDFFPFDENDLRKYDPVGYTLMEKIWGIRHGPK